ncbi:hypothetical protein NPIL_650681 [Nephila pilipes]|uniref:Uncharacterized protein n=1 Tax=Nephila pilipes TaxID=299642 RepID=A0A8X6Q3L3_NEPPI|nr:hypothetical protein NPIL_650681 [Nephila pilipes]
MARIKQTSPEGAGNSSTTGLSANVETLGDTADETTIEMAAISTTGSIGIDQSRDDAMRCENINFGINQLVQTNSIIFSLEAKMNTIPLFPHCYGPNELEEVRRELAGFKEERSKPG